MNAYTGLRLYVYTEMPARLINRNTKMGNTEMPAAWLINVCPKLTKGGLTPDLMKISRLHADYESPAKNYVNLAASLQTSHYLILMDCPPQYRANKTWEAQLVKKITSSHHYEVIFV